MSFLIKRPLPFQKGHSGMTEDIVEIQGDPLVETSFEPCPPGVSATADHGSTNDRCPCCFQPVVKVTSAGLAYGTFSDFLANLGTNVYTGNDLGNSVYLVAFLDGVNYNTGHLPSPIYTRSAYLEGGNQMFEYAVQFSQIGEWVRSKDGGRIYTGVKMPCICVPTDGRDHTIALEVFFRSPSRAGGYPETRGFASKVVRCCNDASEIDVVVRYRKCDIRLPICGEVSVLANYVKHSPPFSLKPRMGPRNVQAKFDRSNCCADIFLVDRSELNCLGGYRISELGVESGFVEVPPFNIRNVLSTSKKETLLHTLNLGELAGPSSFTLELFDPCGLPFGSWSELENSVH